MQFSWEELKRANDNLNEQITRKDQYAGKLKHLLEKGLAQRLEQSDQIMSDQNDVHMMSLPRLPACSLVRTSFCAGLKPGAELKEREDAEYLSVSIILIPDCPHNALHQVIRLLKGCADTSMNSVDGDGAR